MLLACAAPTPGWVERFFLSRRQNSWHTIEPAAKSMVTSTKMDANMIGRAISRYETVDKLGAVATGNPAGPKLMS